MEQITSKVYMEYGKRIFNHIHDNNWFNPRPSAYNFIMLHHFDNQLLCQRIPKRITNQFLNLINQLRYKLV